MEAGLPAVDLFERGARARARTTARCCSAAPPPSSPTAGSRTRSPASPAQLAQHPGWLPGHATICRLRWLAGEREDFTASFEAAVAAAPREIAIWREWADTLMHAGHYDAALAVVAGGRAAAGSAPRLRRARDGRGRRKGRDRRRRRAVRGARADRATSPWRRAICATCCAPAAPPRRRHSPSPGSAIRRPISSGPMSRPPGG